MAKSCIVVRRRLAASRHSPSWNWACKRFGSVWRRSEPRLVPTPLRIDGHGAIAAQQASTTFQTGTVSDDLRARASYGTLWSPWHEFHVLV